SSQRGAHALPCAFDAATTMPPIPRPLALHPNVRGLNALDARIGHVRPCSAQRAAGIDATRGVLDDERLEAGLSRVERGPRDAEVGGRAHDEGSRQPALREIARQLRLDVL